MSIGKTVKGQNILAIKVTKNATQVQDGSRPSVLYSSTQHAREWITTEMNRRLLHYYLEKYATNAAIQRVVDKTELWFVPLANPDGYDYTFTEGNRLWRKNLRDNDGDGVTTGLDGVDPNRNFPYRWGYDNEGSSPSFGRETYRGTGPASEPETRALDGLMRKIKFKFQINYHSAAELLLYGVGWQVATPTPDDLLYETLAGDDAKPAVPGYDPDISAELYTTNGETTEHAHNRYGTLAFTPEMSTCETASAIDPNDAFDPDDCESVFNFPDSEALIQAEFEKNIPFAVAIARSGKDPDDPVSVVGQTAPDFQVDSFDVSYGDPAAGGRHRAPRPAESDHALFDQWQVGFHCPVREWRGGERYGNEAKVYYAEFRGVVRVPAECEAGFLLEEHPFLLHYLTLGDACTATGTSGKWNAMTGNSDGWQQVTFDLSAYAGQQVEVSISYVTDPSTGGAGVFVDDTKVLVDGAVKEQEGFEAGLGAWSVPGPPAGSPPAGGDFRRAQGLFFPAVTTADSVLLGFGIEQIESQAERAAVLGKALKHLLPSTL